MNESTSIDLVSEHVRHAAVRPTAGGENRPPPIIGAHELLPIQLDFLQDRTDVDQYAQYARIALPVDTTRAMLDAALVAIVERHDALRLKFRQTSTGWIAQYRPDALQAGDPILAETLVEVEGASWLDARAEAAAALSGLDIKQGKLQRWVWRRDAQGQSLLWVIHHLVVDTVSWRILSEDLQAALTAAQRGERVELGVKSDSYQDWALRVHDYAFGRQAEQERDYWLQQLATPVVQFVWDAEDADAGPQPEATTRVVEIALGSEDTQQLLQRTRNGVPLQALLVAALTRALGERLDGDAVRIDLEGHGRDLKDGEAELDLSRTIGWCTSPYPVRFDRVRQSLKPHLRRTRRMLSAVPNGGIGYGALQQIAHDEALEVAAEATSGSGILFNYPGLPETEGGSAISPRRLRGHALRIDGMMLAGSLQLRFDYSARQLTSSTVTAIAEGFVEGVRAILSIDPGDSVFADHDHDADDSDGLVRDDTPFALAGLPAERLSALQADYPTLRDVYPCTLMQQGLLMFSDGGAQKDLYLSQMQFMLARVDAGRLRRSWQGLVDRHDILRTAFVDVGQAQLMQLVVSDAPVSWREEDLRADGHGELSQAALTRLKREEMAQGFELTQAPLMRLMLVRLADDRDCLVWTHHHALIDGWSAAVLIRQLFQGYAANGQAEDTPAEPPYRRYIAWQSTRDPAAAEAYWRGYFRGLDVSVSAQMPLERRVEAQGHRQVRYEQGSTELELSAEVTARLTRLAQAEGVSLSTLMLVAWGLLLGKYIGEEEVLFGYTTSGRSAPVDGIESMVGLFINSLPVRVRAEGSQTIGSLLRAVQSQLLDNEDHGLLSLPEIQRLSGAKPGQALFDTLVVVENYPRDWSLLASGGEDGLNVRSISGASQTSFGLNLIAYPGEQLMLELAYQRLQFDDAATAALLQRLSHLLCAMANGATQTIAGLSMLSAEEQARAIQDWNATALVYPRERTLPEVFGGVAQAHQDAVALVFGEERWTYRELSQRARGIARWLRAHGVRSGDHLALSMDKGPWLIASMLGIMEAGAAYVPVAVDCPADRRAFIVSDARIVWTLTERAHRAQVSAGADACLEIEDSFDAIEGAESADVDAIGEGVATANESQAMRTAYIIYTSGTTGTPKGVAIPHRSLINFCAWCVDARLFTAGSRMTQFAPYTFDASAGEIFGGLLAGAELHLLADALIMDPKALTAYLNTQAIEFGAFPPPYLQQIDPAQIPEGMVLLTAGSAPSAELVMQWGARCRYINGYGPTETTILSTAWICERGEVDVGALSIGRPICNTSVYVVDRMGQLCAPGLLGEIWIGGDGVANEYLNRPELNGEQFLVDPWKMGGRVYRTGDMGRWRADGQVEFVGRRDRQVKLRGFRIELDEIENRLRAHPQVQGAAVSVRGMDSDKRLLAWVTRQDKEGIEVTTEELFLDALRVFLGASLPSCMMPQAIMVIAQMPLTGNGKVDEKALPEPTLTATAEAAYVAPRNDIERALVEVWAAVLKLAPEQISTNANFFELGGHSLLAMRATAQLRERLGVELGVADLLAQPVLSDLALVAEHASQPALPPIVAVARTETMPLSFAQQRLWFLAQMEDVSQSYHIPGALRLLGALDVRALKCALDGIVSRHEVLRATFVMDGETPMQRFAPAQMGFMLAEHDLSAPLGDRKVDAETSLYARMREEFAAPFDLTAGPLIRGQLLRMNDDDHVLLITIHHIVMDGWSMGMLVRELGQWYRSAQEGGADPLPALEVQYADYAVWQRSLSEADIWKAQRAYWHDMLHDAPAMLELPTDRLRPQQQCFDGAKLSIALDATLTNSLRALSQRHGVTLFTTMLAAWAIVLQRLSAQQDVVIGIPAANRLQAELAPLVGLFINTLAVRVGVEADTSIEALLKQVKQRLLGAQANQQFPFEQVVEAVNPPRSLAHTPIFQVMLSWIEAEWSDIDLQGLSITMESPPDVFSKFDLTLDLVEDADGIKGEFEYETALFDRETVERHAGYFRKVLEAMVYDDASLVCQIELLDRQERDLLDGYNDTYRPELIDTTWPGLFLAQVSRTPDAIAVECETRRMTYRELEMRSAQFASCLQREGVGADTIVALLDHRSTDLLVMIVSVLRAGGAYLALDPTHPPQRWLEILEDAGPHLLWIGGRYSTEQRWLKRKWKGGKISNSDDLAATMSEADLASAPALMPPALDDLSYVLFTSGSTGKPKGVMIEHRGMINNMRAKFEPLSLTEHDVIAQTASQCFDISVWQFLTAMLLGAKVVIFSDETTRDPDAMLHRLAETGVTIWEPVPSVMQVILPFRKPLPRLRWVMPTGEALSRELVVHWFKQYPQVPLMNAYGPAECSDDVSFQPIHGPVDRVLIGKPVANAHLHLLDDHLMLVPLGAVGEIAVSGPVVGRGYHNRPDETRTSFRENPYPRHAADGRIYLTGDLGRRHADGSIEFVGRKDFQVKIRGFRIELGEIENCLESHPAVREAVVVAHAFVEHGDKNLVAYVTASATTDIEALRAHIRSTLPDYMVPQFIMKMDRMPLTPNGKIDRKALPKPVFQEQDDLVYAAPETPAEKVLARIWQDLLGKERVGRDDHFFRLGGHSILAIALIARLREAGYKTDIRTVLTLSTLSALALGLTTEKERNPAAALELPPNLIAADCVAITPEMLPLAELSQQDIDRIVADVPGGMTNVQDIYRLGPLQEGILFQSLVGGKNDPYLMETTLAFDTRETLDRFLSALQTMVERHEVLRTSIHWDGLPEPVQVVQRSAMLPIDETTSDNVGSMLLNHAPLMRARVRPRSDGGWSMALVLHHIICDEVSTEILLSEIAAVAQGAGESLPPPASYRDFIAGVRVRDPDNSHAYLRNQLADIDEPTLAFDVSDLNMTPETLGYARLRLSEETSQRLQLAAAAHAVTQATVLHLAWALTIGACSGRDDVVIGTVVSGRQHDAAQTNSAVGMFINTVPLRLAVGELSVKDAVWNAHVAISELLMHEQTPLGVAQRYSSVSPGTPLFNAIINYRYAGGMASLASGDLMSGVRVVDEGDGQQQSNYPFSLDVEASGNLLEVKLQCIASVDPQRMASYLRAALEQIVGALESDPGVAMRSLDIFPADERKRVLEDWNRTETALPPLETVHGMFAKQALATPDAIAVVQGDAQLSYAQLHAQSDAIARRLMATGCGHGNLIGLFLERTPLMLAALLGALKSGAAYVPIDPAFPSDRIRFMLEDAALTTIITDRNLTARLPVGAYRTLFADEFVAANADEVRNAAALPVRTNGTDDLAYVIFTSGSTGRPKGVCIPHRAAVNFLRSMAKSPGMRTTDTVCAITTLSFDIALLELVLPLTVGARVAIADRATTLDGSRLARFMIDSETTFMQATPATWRMLIESGWEGRTDLRMLCGGEALPMELADKLLVRGAELWNMYGPTETTVWSTVERIETGVEAITVGRPIDNTVVYVVDKYLRPTPIGVPGELLIGGAGMACGYLHREDLTAEKFITGAQVPNANARLYRTGDLARWREDGRLQVLGRLDHQVKVRGFRIELGEIESVLATCPGIEQAVVVCHDDRLGEKRLDAFLVASTSTTAGKIDIDNVRDHARARLPDYMLPSGYRQLDALPLTPNGKIDRKSLSQSDPLTMQAVDFEQPATAHERMLANIWERVLSLDGVGRDDDFFALGGNSILMMRVVGMLKAGGVAVDVADVYRLRTLKAIASTFGEDAGQDAVSAALTGIAHAVARVVVDSRQVGVLIVDRREAARLETLRIALTQAASDDFDYILLSDSPQTEAAEYALGQRALPDIGEAQSSGEMAETLNRQFRAWCDAAAAASRVETYPFSIIQRHILDQPARDSVQSVVLHGWHTAEALQSAFATLMAEQDLLRSLPDFAGAQWHLLDAAAIGSARLPVVCAPRIGEVISKEQEASLLSALQAAKASSGMAYAALWLSESHMRHRLLLLLDHVVWDAVSMNAMQRRLSDMLAGKALPLSETYRDFARHREAGGDLESWDRIGREFDHARTAEIMVDTERVLRAKSAMALQAVRLSAPLHAGQTAVEQAFEWFKRWVLALTGTDAAGVVLNHHGRLRGDISYFDHVGLFLDKIPVVVSADTTLRELTVRAEYLQREGLGYAALEALARRHGRDPVLPPLAYEVMFNFRSVAVEAEAMDTEAERRFAEALHDYCGILFEAQSHEQDNQIVVTCAFRGSDGDLRGLMSTIPDSVLIESSMTVDAADAAAGTGMTATPNAGTTEDDVLIVEGVHKRYGDFEAVKGVSFRVPRGKCFGILGPNGAGKTSLLAMIEGLTDITSGSIRIFGMDVATQMRSIQPHLGVQLQQNNYFQFLTVAQLLKFYQELRSAVGGKREGPSAEWLLERLELKDKLSFKVDELSGGQKQRLSIAIALLEDPDIIFLDEPTSALDPQSRIYTWEFIEQLKNDGRKTIILTTHYMEEAERLCDDIMIMNGGKIIAHGPPAELVKSLSATQSLNLQFGNTRLEAAHAQSIGALDGVISHGWDERSDTLSIQTTDVAKTLEAVLATCRDRGIPITNIDIVRPSLEDVFLSHTGKDLRE